MGERREYMIKSGERKERRNRVVYNGRKVKKRV
jgi:hypothetical protein